MISFAATPQWHLVPWTGTLVTNAQWSGSSYFKPLNANRSLSPMGGTFGCLYIRLLSQMPNSQGGSSAASLFSSFSTDAESRGEAPVALGGSFWSSSLSVAGSKGVLLGLFRGLWGRRPSRLLAQMPNSQGGSDAASLYSYFCPPRVAGAAGNCS